MTPAAREQLILAWEELPARIVSKLSLPESAGIDAEDLVSAGLIGLIAAVDSYDASRRVPFGAWATVRVRWAVIDALRASGSGGRGRGAGANPDPEPGWFEDAPDAGAVDPLSAALASAEGRQAVLALSLLPAQQRTVVALHDLWGWTLCEIAAWLSLSIARVSKVRKAGLLRLRAEMGGDEE